MMRFDKRLAMTCGFAVLLGTSCSKKKDAAPDAPPADPPPADAAPAEPTTNSTDAPTPLKAHMQEHFAAIRLIQTAIVASDLQLAKQTASWLAKHKPHEATQGWEQHLGRVRGAAERMADAKDIPEAATLAAELAGQCAACHLATKAITSFPWEPPPEAKSTLRSQMQRHQWAAERLWEGIVGPSDARWQEGVDLFAQAKLDVTALVGGDMTQRGTAEAAAGFVDTQLRRAGEATTREERTSLYGALLSGCASCHAAVRSTASP